MKWSEVKEENWFQWLTNKYVLISTLFVVWMIFFDDASLLQHVRIDNQISESKNDVAFYEAKLKDVKTELQKVKDDSKSIEKIARERFYMKKDNEDIFVLVNESPKSK